jgi:hypothetical protein
MNPTTASVVVLYLAAIIAANLSAAHFGPEASVVNAFLFIGLNLTARDILHDVWQRHRVPKMAALILTGGLLSYLVNADAARIAIASCAAFAASETVDFAVYSWRHRRPWLERSNLRRLCASYERVCIGSSGQYATLGTPAWHRRMEAAMNVACRHETPYLHMLRGMAFSGSQYPFASVDSTDIGRNHNRDQNDAVAMARRWDRMQCPAKWVPREQLALVEGAI